MYALLVVILSETRRALYSGADKKKVEEKGIENPGRYMSNSVILLCFVSIYAHTQNIGAAGAAAASRERGWSKVLGER
jgi:hypothetical protein